MTDGSEDERQDQNKKTNALAAAHAVAAIEALITSTVANRDVTAGVAHGCVAHHLTKVRVEGVVVIDRCFGLHCDRSGRNDAVAFLVRRSDLRRAHQLRFFGRRNVRELVTLQVLDTEDAEHVVDDRSRDLDVRVAIHHALGASSGKASQRDGVPLLGPADSILRSGWCASPPGAIYFARHSDTSLAHLEYFRRCIHDSLLYTIARDDRAFARMCG